MRIKTKTFPIINAGPAYVSITESKEQPTNKIKTSKKASCVCKLIMS